MAVGRDREEARTTPGMAAARVLIGAAVVLPVLALFAGYCILWKLHELGDRTLDAVDGFLNAK